MNSVFWILRSYRTVHFLDINTSSICRNGNVSRSNIVEGNAELYVEADSKNTFVQLRGFSCCCWVSLARCVLASPSDEIWPIGRELLHTFISAFWTWAAPLEPLFGIISIFYLCKIFLGRAATIFRLLWSVVSALACWNHAGGYLVECKFWVLFHLDLKPAIALDDHGASGHLHFLSPGENKSCCCIETSNIARR